MKYTISQQRLNDFRKSYLENTLENVSMLDSFIVINRSQDSGYQEDVIMEYDYEDGRLYIEKDFSRGFADMLFPNEDSETVARFIMDWFENTFGVNVEYSQTK